MKRLAKILFLGLLIGLTAVVLKISLKIPNDTFRKYYACFGILFILGAVLFNLIYNYMYGTRMRRLIPLLEGGRTQEYIDALLEIRQKTRSHLIRQVCTVNLSAGYSDLKQYDKALNALYSISGNKLRGLTKMVYHLNLCACLFYAEKPADALQEYHASQELFAPFKNSEGYGGNLAVLDIFAFLYEGESQKAAELLDSASRKWKNPRLADDFRHLALLLEKPLIPDAD